ncbi:MAG: carboxypeptidase regulatory-like domain-containing protein [Oscillospiraceae bacterium]|jgi:Fe-S-cluster-containing dehydrogenase component|nr:carboxypeptidase regulatory-like domain-containing protein [Oscillospiraceae bacterium]
MKVFTVDVSKCNGCYNCQLACKDEHSGNDWSPYAKPQPETGQFWLRVRDFPQGTVPKVRIHYVAEMCNHCANAACLAACPNGAVYRREDGLVLIDPAKCVGCGACAVACPYDAVFYNEELKICQKCTGCAHLLDNGFALPRCVDACPTEAISFAEESELSGFIVGADVRLPETGLRPRVYYRNIPGYFVAGTVYDPVEKEVATGAAVRLTNGGKTLHAVTDEYGDFWFNDLRPGRYELIVEAAGFEYLAIDGIDASSGSVNLGDLALRKKQ